MTHAASSKENIDQARAAVVTLVRGFFEESSWQVQVRWEPDGAAGS